LFKAGYQVEENAFNGLLNNVFYKLKDILVNSCFLAGLVIFIGFLILNYQRLSLISILLYVFFYFVFWFCILFFVNPKFTNLVDLSLRNTLQIGSFEASTLKNQYRSLYFTLDNQSKIAVCT